MMPVLFKIGSFPVHTWGLLLMAGFVLAAWRVAKHAPRYGFTREDAYDVSLWGLLGGIVGARLAFTLLNWSYYAAHPLQVLAVWDGGMTFYGGMAGGIGAGVLVCRAKRISVADMADLAAVSFPLGYALGRVGCFLNGCCYGGACELPWAVQFRPEHGPVTVPSHPAQLYSALAAVLIYLLLLPLERRRRFRGQVMLAFLQLYGVYRFFVEFVREGVTADVTSIAHLTQGQIASLVLSLVAAVLYVWADQRARRRRLSAAA